MQLGYLQRVALGIFAGERGGLPGWDQLEGDVAEGCGLWLASVGVFLPLLAATAGVGSLVSAVGLRPLGVARRGGALPVAALATRLYLPAALLATAASGSMTAAFDAGSLTGRLHTVLAQAWVAVAAEIFAQLGLLLACAGMCCTRFAAPYITGHAFASAWASAPAFQAPLLAGAKRE